VWNDLNGDGVQQTTEPGMSNIDATLFDGDGVELDTTTTDENGEYLFTDLPPRSISSPVLTPRRVHLYYPGQE